MTNNLMNHIEMIPPLPQSVREVERVYHDPESTFEDLRKVIEKDPLLTTDILRAANAPLYGMKRQITNVQQAVSLLGRDVVRTFALNTVVNANFTINLSPYAITKEQFSLACERQLALMINWLIRREPTRLAKLAPAAFLVDIGRVIISRSLLDEGKAALIQQALDEGKEIGEAEKAACGSQTTDVTATIFNRWHFEADIVHLIRYSDDPDGTYGIEREMAAELKAVRETVLPNGEITEASIAAAKRTIAEYDLDRSGFERALERLLHP